MEDKTEFEINKYSEVNEFPCIYSFDFNQSQINSILFLAFIWHHFP